MTTTVTEAPAVILTPAGPERVTLPFPATEYLAERSAVVIGVGEFEPTRDQLVYAEGRRDATYGDPHAELPVTEWVAARRARGY